MDWPVDLPADWPGTDTGSLAWTGLAWPGIDTGSLEWPGLAWPVDWPGLTQTQGAWLVAWGLLWPVANTGPELDMWTYLKICWIFYYKTICISFK